MAVKFLHRRRQFMALVVTGQSKFQKGYTNLIASLWPFKGIIRDSHSALVHQMSRNFIFLIGKDSVRSIITMVTNNPFDLPRGTSKQVAILL